MDLSTRAAKRLRLDDFLKQNLVEAPAKNLIEWVDSSQGVFRILWTHQSSGDFNTGDAALFRYWAIARGKSPDGLSSVDLKQSLRMALNKSPSVHKLPAVHDDRYYRYFRVKEHILSDWWKDYPEELHKFSKSGNQSSTDYTRPCLPSHDTSEQLTPSLPNNNCSMNVPLFLDEEHSSYTKPPTSHRGPGQLFRPYAMDPMDSHSLESPLLLDEKDHYAPTSYDESLILENDSRNMQVNSLQHLSPDGGYYSSSGSSPGSSSLDDISRTMYLNPPSHLMSEGGYYSSPGSSPGSSREEDKLRKNYMESNSLVLPEKIEYLAGEAPLYSTTDLAARSKMQSEGLTNINRYEWVPPTLSNPSDDCTSSSKHTRNNKLKVKAESKLARGSHYNMPPSNCYPNFFRSPDDGFKIWNDESMSVDYTDDSTIGETKLEPTSLWGQSYQEQEQCFQLQSF